MSVFNTLFLFRFFSAAWLRALRAIFCEAWCLKRGSTLWFLRESRLCWCHLFLAFLWASVFSLVTPHACAFAACWGALFVERLALRVSRECVGVILRLWDCLFASEQASKRHPIKQMKRVIRFFFSMFASRCSGECGKPLTLCEWLQRAFRRAFSLFEARFGRGRSSRQCVWFCVKQWYDCLFGLSNLFPSQ